MYHRHACIAALLHRGTGRSKNLTSIPLFQIEQNTQYKITIQDERWMLVDIDEVRVERSNSNLHCTEKIWIQVRRYLITWNLTCWLLIWTKLRFHVYQFFVRDLSATIIEHCQRIDNVGKQIRVETKKMTSYLTQAWHRGDLQDSSTQMSLPCVRTHVHINEYRIYNTVPPRIWMNLLLHQQHRPYKYTIQYRFHSNKQLHDLLCAFLDGYGTLVAGG